MVKPSKFWMLIILISSLVTILTLSSFASFSKKKPLRENPPEFTHITKKPLKIGNFPPPNLSSKSILVIDFATDTVLFEKNSNLKISPASLTKLATALVVSEKCSQSQIITVPKIATPPGTKMGLYYGEKITVENLLYGLLLPSGNDAANALVSGCFGSFEDFLITLSNLTQKLGMENTQFVNSSGLPSKDHFSTAKDLVKLTKAALGNKKISQIVSTKEKVVSDVDGKISHKLINLNKLLDNPKILGVKTGRSNFGENLIVLKEVKGEKVISLILQSQDRFLDTEKILEWVEESFVWGDSLD